MKRMAGAVGALVLTVSLAAPAAAAQKVQVFEEESFAFPGEDFGVAIDLDNDLWTSPEAFDEDWACRDKVIYYQIKGEESLTLWYPKSVAEDAMMPDGEAWPWTKGQYTNAGTDYFAANEAMTNKVISGKYSWKSHIYDHVIDNPETWKERVTGKFWGINIPGYGTVIHETGIFWNDVEVVFNGEPEQTYFDVGSRGNSTFDYDELCDYYDAGPAVFLP